MKDILALKKPSTALQLSLQLTRVALDVVVGHLTDDTFRELLLGNPQEILTLVKAINEDAVSDEAYDHICRIVEDAAYDPGLAARESEAGFFLDLDTLLTRLRRELAAAHDERRRLSPTTAFCVGVDGSRQSYLAFEATTRLRRHGVVTVVHVDEEQGAHSIQLPAISTDVIVQEYQHHANRLRLPRNRIVVDSVSHDAPSSSVASELLNACATHRADFLVLGSVGKGGPAIDQVGHVPREVLRFAPLPVVLVPPAPILAVPSPSLPSLGFVVAVDASPLAARCLHAVLKLMKPRDRVRIVHFFKKPLVGSYDEQPFAHCHAFLATANVADAVVEILPLDAGTTVAESLHEYTAKHAASFLVMGLNGDSVIREPVDQDQSRDNEDDAPEMLENRIGRIAAAMLLSPRCALCLCP